MKWEVLVCATGPLIGLSRCRRLGSFGRPLLRIAGRPRGLFLWLALSIAPLAGQTVPQTLNHQGRVTVDGVPFHGTGHFKFAIVTAGGALSRWSNDGSSQNGLEPAKAVDLQVSNGSYSLRLGDSSMPNMQPVPPAVFSEDADLLLRIWFDDGVHGSKALSPDLPIASVGFAMMAAQANSLAPAAAINPAVLAANPVAGQVLSYDGQAMVWQNPAGGGGSPLFSAGTNLYFNSGNLGLGTTAFEHRLSVTGGPLWTMAGWKGALALQSGDAIGWGPNKSSSYRFGMGYTGGGFYFFRTESPLGTFPGSPALYDLMISEAGHVGIGTLTPGAPLDIRAVWNTPGTSGVPNTQLSGPSPTLAWVKTGSFPRSSWIAHLGATDGLEFWQRVQSGVPGAAGDTGWIRKLGFTPDGGIDYTGQLGKLDTAEHAASTVRAADLKLGHSTRRGTPGRALVDLGPTLAVNFADDWGTTVIGGAVTEVKTLRITGGADLAEPFPMSQSAVPPGAVVVIDEKNPGKLRMSTVAYDKKVAGIVSGADGIQPGISMLQADRLNPGLNVALSGRVYVSANTSGGPIEPGDLLTTSEAPGQAMKVTDHLKAQGAILGKAMSALAEGHGLVLVLVTLQ